MTLELIGRVEKLIGSGEVSSKILRMKYSCLDAARSVALKNVTKASRPSAIMLQKARRDRNPFYAVAADLAVEIDLLFNRQDRDAYIHLLKSGWFEPLPDDDLFELYVLAVLIEIYEQDLGWKLTSLGLVHKGRKEVAKFVAPGNNDSVSLYFEQSPVTFLDCESRYTELLAEYAGLTGNVRRPDISILLRREDETVRLLLVEMKDSEDTGYIRESIYKVFGYVYDFESVWADQEQLKALLVFPSSVDRTVKTENDVVLVSAEDRAALAELIALG